MSDTEGTRTDVMKQMQSNMNEMRKNLDAITAEIRTRAEETAEAGREKIRERPIMAVGLAFGAGLIFGAIMLKALSCRKD